MIISDYWPGFPLKGPLLCAKTFKKSPATWKFPYAGVASKSASRQQRVAKGISISTSEVGWKKHHPKQIFTSRNIFVTESGGKNVTLFVECLLRVVVFFRKETYRNLQRFSK